MGLMVLHLPLPHEPDAFPSTYPIERFDDATGRVEGSWAVSYLFSHCLRGPGTSPNSTGPCVGSEGHCDCRALHLPVAANARWHLSRISLGPLKPLGSW